MKEFIPKSPIKFGIHASRPHQKWVILAFASVFFAVTFDRGLIIVLGNLANILAAKRLNIHDLWFWAILYPIIYFVAELFWRSSGFTGMRWFNGLRGTSTKTLFSYLSYHSKDYFSNNFAGALTNKISNSIEGIENLLQKILWRFMPIVVGVIWYVIIAWFVNIWLGVIIAIWSLVFLGINLWFGNKLKTKSFLFAEASSDLKGRIVDSLSNITLVHEYAYVQGEHEYIGQYIKKYQDAGLSSWVLSEIVLSINNFLTFLFILASLGITVYLFQLKTINIGDVVMMLAMIGNMSSQLFFLGQEIRDAWNFYGQAKEGLGEILEAHKIVDIDGASVLDVKSGDITFENVTFEYENTKVFKKFSIDIPAGQKLGLVGRSGAGKTTFVSLLLRHFDIIGGAIKLDGQDIKSVTLESLRRSIAFVPQDTSLFHRSILENIRYSNPYATTEQVEKASKLAQAHEFITKLPNGYETMVGERGVKLSGGQRQRIAIARAFLKNAPILILDEATSSLDSESEHAVQDALGELMKGRTVIAIAHRLSTLKSMDRIVLIDNGKIVEDGVPEKLLKKKDGLFKTLWEHQVKGFIMDEES
ncbi:MAG TPA: ABC transporter ATP-binding protein [Patescibacteria group bacterium]|nr:ABC transporter ATP-binding protein [Patescibacteria group bacterium]